MVESLPSIHKDQGSIPNTSISKNPLLNEIISLKHLIFAEYRFSPSLIPHVVPYIGLLVPELLREAGLKEQV